MGKGWRLAITRRWFRLLKWHVRIHYALLPFPLTPSRPPCRSRCGGCRPCSSRWFGSLTPCSHIYPRFLHHGAEWTPLALWSAAKKKIQQAMWKKTWPIGTDYGLLEGVFFFLHFYARSYSTTKYPESSKERIIWIRCSYKQKERNVNLINDKEVSCTIFFFFTWNILFLMIGLTTSAFYAQLHVTKAVSKYNCNVLHNSST